MLSTVVNTLIFSDCHRLLPRPLQTQWFRSADMALHVAWYMNDKNPNKR